MRKFTFCNLLAFLLLSNFCFSQQQIPASFYGTNYWMPDSTGNTPLGGQVQNPVVMSKITAMNPGVIRVGGNGYDTDGNIFNQYDKACQNVIAMGGEPLVQIPIKYGGFTFTPSQAQALVFFLNVTKNRGIKYFSIGNEWDAYPSPYNKLDSISARFKRFAAAIKTAYPTAKNNILIVGPSPSWFGVQDGGSQPMLRRLVGNPGGSYDITGPVNTTLYPSLSGYYYLDIIDWHDYPFNMRNINSGNYTTTRNNAVAYPGGTSPFQFNNNLDTMNTWIANANSIHGRTTKPLKFSITEMNITYKNPYPYNPSTDYNDTLKNSAVGIGCASFFAGQFWADMYSEMIKKGGNNAAFMTPWSIHEKNGNRDTTDFGMLDSSIASGTRERSTYYHQQMLSNYFAGRKYYAGSSNKSPYVKSFASVEDSAIMYVMVINRNALSYKLSVDFNTADANTPASNPLMLGFQVPLVVMPMDSFPTTTDSIGPHETILIAYNCHGSKVWKKVYNEQKAKSNTPPQIQQIGNTDVDPQIANCGSSGIGGHITSNTTYSNTTVYVSSDILITGNNTLTFDHATVIFSPGKKITANPNAGIEIKNGTVMFGCNGSQWGGIIMNGNHQLNDHLIIDNSILVNAPTVVTANKIGTITIKGSVFANGTTAIKLDRSKAFTLSGNLIAGYKTAVQTTNTNPNYVSTIKENRIISVEKGFDFNNDSHDMLTIACNYIGYNSKGIYSRNTVLAAQGDATTSAGNVFVKTGGGTPSDYIDHTGSSTSYFYGPMEAGAYLFPTVMNIPKIQAVSDKFCLQQTGFQCKTPVGIAENTKPEGQFLIYPNPSSGAFTIKWNDLPKGNWMLEVHDILGRMISSQKINTSLESTTLQIISKGMYFVSLQNGSDRITQKVIVE